MTVDVQDALDFGESPESGSPAISGQPEAESPSGEQRWLATFVVVLGTLLGIFIVIYIGKILLRLVAFGICVASGVGGVLVFAPWLRGVFHEGLPSQIQGRVSADVLSVGIAFLGGYVVAILLLSVLSRPLRGPRVRKQ